MIEVLNPTSRDAVSWVSCLNWEEGWQGLERAKVHGAAERGPIEEKQHLVAFPLNIMKSPLFQ